MSRTVDAPAARVFAFLADPANHPALDATGMVRFASPGAAITAVGDVFVMHMRNEFKGDYRVENHVVVYEPGRALGWAPASPGDEPAGHTFVWRLTPDGDRTIVSQAYDWSAFTHLQFLDRLPVVGHDQLRETLDRLAAAVTETPGRPGP